MNQFKNASTIKPILSTKALSITARGHDSVRTKSKKNKTRGGSVSGFQKAYANSTTNKDSQKALQDKHKTKAAEDIVKAKNIFITGTEDQEQDDVAPNPDEEPRVTKEDDIRDSPRNVKQTHEVDKPGNDKTNNI